MFKNRSIQLKYVKDPKDPTTEDDFVEMIPVDYEKIGELLEKSALSFRETIELIAMKAIIGVAVYVAVDTLRQVIIKQTPTN